jgi:hypothetical protein
MRASSDTIAQLAAAMAKAQSELVNPVKSLTAVIERANGSGTQSYKYAPLSSGLDIVRKSLGKYELALIQTTHVDRERSLVLLTTTIAHGSGEWISGLWPVCTMADLAHPKLMGAALTYARRYCLFTMVGLAGEDDLDAPDLLPAKPLNAGANGADSGTIIRADREAPPQGASCAFSSDRDPDNDAGSSAEIESPRRRRRGVRKAPLSTSFALSEDPSGDLVHITDADTLFRWALETLPARNKLDEEQRAALDTAFLARADAIGADPELLTPFAFRNAPLPVDDRPALSST